MSRVGERAGKPALPACSTASTGFNIRNLLEIPATELRASLRSFIVFPTDPWKQGGTGLG